jgi:hypothetical protein
MPDCTCGFYQLDQQLTNDPELQREFVKFMDRWVWQPLLAELARDEAAEQE